MSSGKEWPVNGMSPSNSVSGSGSVSDVIRGGDARSSAVRPPLVRRAKDSIVPASYGQEGLWFLEQLELAGAGYNLMLAQRLVGKLDEEALVRSLMEVVSRHESLNTCFQVKGGMPYQVIRSNASMELRRHSLEAIRDPRQRGEELQEYMKREQLLPFDLSEGPLFRATLVTLNTHEYVLLLTMHHIVTDGWSKEILLREVGTLYGAYLRGEPSPLAELPIQYADYSNWQREWLERDVIRSELTYWRKQLTGMPGALELPFDRPRPPVTSFKGAALSFAIPASLCRQLGEVARREASTLFMVLLSAYQFLLSRYSSQEDVIVGSPIAGRTNTKTEGLIGYFVNTLLLRTDLSGNPTFRELLHRVRGTVLAAYAHQHLPLAKLVMELRPDRSLTRQSIFQVMLGLHNYTEEKLELVGLECAKIDYGNVTAICDLELQLFRGAATAKGEPAGLRGVFLYATDLFDEATIQRMARHFQLLLERVAADPDRSLLSLSSLPEAERHQVIRLFNATEVAYPSERLIHELFEEQVKRTPGAVAVIYEDRSLTYAELNTKANQLAHYLRARQIGPDQLVGICVERSLEMVVGVLGILKAGGAYVPMDPSYPTERLHYMLNDAAPGVLLTQGAVEGALTPW